MGSANRKLFRSRCAARIRFARNIGRAHGLANAVQHQWGGLQGKRGRTGVLDRKDSSAVHLDQKRSADHGCSSSVPLLHTRRTALPLDPTDRTAVSLIQNRARFARSESMLRHFLKNTGRNSLKISATVVTLNEERNIARALESLRCV